MAKHKTYNPEKRTWRGISYKKVRENIRKIRDKAVQRTDAVFSNRN